MSICYFSEIQQEIVEKQFMALMKTWYTLFISRVLEIYHTYKHLYKKRLNKLFI